MTSHVNKIPRPSVQDYHISYTQFAVRNQTPLAAKVELSTTNTRQRKAPLGIFLKSAALLGVRLIFTKVILLSGAVTTSEVHHSSTTEVGGKMVNDRGAAYLLTEEDGGAR